ncbi:MAG: response regulator [Myxacorys chilensis ATA2-1-KO14]|jgi:hypothetical protein|nr:response regulator [Myxacorys chilensis ATA2-1-KO14]
MNLHLHRAIQDSAIELSLRQVLLRNNPATDCLAAELWVERYLNGLHLQLNAALSKGILETDSKSVLEDEVLKTFVHALSRGLDEEIIAIAKPTTHPDQVAIHHTAGALHCSPPSLAHQVISLARGSLLTVAELTLLEQTQWQTAWHMVDCQGELGWLITAPSKLELTAIEDRFLPLRSHLIARASAQTIPMLRQAQQMQHLSERCNALQAENHTLIQTSKLKSEFLANTSHEIRTPLSSILGFTHLLREQGYDATNLRHQDYLKIILSSGQHLLALINDILDLSKIEANQLDLQQEITEVKPVCQIALKLVQEKASDKRLALKLDIAPDSTTITADPLRLKQMLFNLLSNALKFTTCGSVGLTVRSNDGYMQFTVWDTGIGISDEQQQLLFRPYTQLTSANRGEGTGLGLALTRKLAELHGGWVRAESVLGQGSRFTIALPLSKPQPKQPDVESTLFSASSLLAASSLDLTPSVPLELRGALIALNRVSNPTPSNHILLVEDNIPNARLMMTFLGKLGYKVAWVQDNREMWQSLKQTLPAMILMDIHLPGADGLSLTRELQAQECYRSIPVIVQTAMAMKGDRERCLEAGASDYVSKPIDLAVLAKTVAKYCLTQNTGLTQNTAAAVEEQK